MADSITPHCLSVYSGCLTFTLCIWELRSFISCGPFETLQCETFLWNRNGQDGFSMLSWLKMNICVHSYSFFFGGGIQGSWFYLTVFHWIPGSSTYSVPYQVLLSHISFHLFTKVRAPPKILFTYNVTCFRQRTLVRIFAWLGWD